VGNPLPPKILNVPEPAEKPGDDVQPDGEYLHPADREWPRPWMSTFLRALSLVPEVTSASRVARISKASIYTWRKDLPEFAEAWDEALEMAKDYVVRHAHTWLTTGVPVRSLRTVTKRKTDAEGRVIETTTETVETESAERSATLMIFWLKAFHPDRFRWSERAEITGADGGPVRIESIEEIDRRIAELAEELEQTAGGEPVPDEPAIPVDEIPTQV
jgi:hypothetical protein